MPPFNVFPMTPPPISLQPGSSDPGPHDDTVTAISEKQYRSTSIASWKKQHQRRRESGLRSGGMGRGKIFSPTRRKSRGSKKRYGNFKSPQSGVRSPLGTLSPNGGRSDTQAAADSFASDKLPAQSLDYVDPSIASSLENSEGAGARRLFGSPTQLGGFSGRTNDRDLPGRGGRPSFQIFSPSSTKALDKSSGATSIICETSASAKSGSSLSLRKERKRLKPVLQEGVLVSEGQMKNIEWAVGSSAEKVSGDTILDQKNEVVNTTTTSAQKTTAVSQKEMATSRDIMHDRYKNFEFVYPTDTVAVPSIKVLKQFHAQAVAVPKEDACGPTRIVIRPTYVSMTSTTKESAVPSLLPHQLRLDRSGSGLLSLESVLIPAVAYEEREALKRTEAMALRAENNTAVAAAKLCRLVVTELAASAALAVRKNRIKREETEIREARMKREQKKLEREQRQKEKDLSRERAKEEKRMLRRIERERRIQEKRKNLPRNKELYREVAVLMTELAQLRKEEIMWKETEMVLHTKEKELDVRVKEAKEKAESREIAVDITKKIGEKVDDTTNAHMLVWHAVDGIIQSTDRINETLKTVKKLMNECDKTKKDLYTTYTEEHQFRGYDGVKNPKGLVKALSQEN